MPKPTIGILGSGDVAKALARGLAVRGHAVVLGSRDAAKLGEFVGKTPGTKAGSLVDAAKAGDVVVLAVLGRHAVEVVTALKAELKGKVVMDATNPIADKPPRDGVLEYFTTPDKSLMEILMEAAPDTKFVKAFNSVGSGMMVDPPFPVTPTMFICGSDPAAKAQVGEIVNSLGWNAEDVGGPHCASPIEALCQTWCALGFNGKGWAHAFTMQHASS